MLKIFILLYIISPERNRFALPSFRSPYAFKFSITLQQVSCNRIPGPFLHLHLQLYVYTCKTYLIYYMSSLRVGCTCHLTAVSKYRDCILQITRLMMKEHFASGAASRKSLIFHYFQITYWQAEKNSLSAFDCG